MSVAAGATGGLAAEAALELRGVSVRFPLRDGAAHGDAYTALHDATLAVGAGEFVAVVGPTGCGKSTLLNVAAGLLAPTAGEVRVGGERLAGINRQAAYVFQTDVLLPWKTTLENVALGLRLRATPPDEARERGRQWLARVGLAHAGERYPHQLSGGMRKRVALAQALIVDPPLLLMDEPFSALDAQTRQLMGNELLMLWQADRKSVLFVTHDLEEAIALADRVVLLSAGPATRPVGDFAVPLPRPRDVAEVRLTPAFLELQQRLWRALRDEVHRSQAREGGLDGGRRPGATG